MKKIALLFFIVVFVFSCKSNSLAILNKDDNAVMPVVENDIFIITKKATDKKYAYTENYPVNLGFSKSIPKNKVSRFFDALRGPNQEKISYTFIESCCPFTSESGSMGTGLLDKYEIKWTNNSSPIYIYINQYEKGEILIPFGLTSIK